MKSQLTEVEVSLNTEIGALIADNPAIRRKLSMRNELGLQKS